VSEEELLNINGIREDLYQAMQIGDITLNSKHSQELYDFMNYQDKEIERLNKELEFEKLKNKEVREYVETKYLSEFDDFEKPFILTDKNDWNKVLEILDKENI